MFKKEGGIEETNEEGDNIDNDPTTPVGFHEDGGLGDVLLNDLLDAAKKVPAKPSGISTEEENLIDEEVHEVDQKVYESFAKVLTYGWTNFLENPGMIVIAMNSMHMGKR